MTSPHARYRDRARGYAARVLDEHKVDPDPIAQFRAWYEQAIEDGETEADAVAFATADVSGRPDVRMVLCRGVDERGFVIYTNRTSSKVADLETNPFGALCFFWSTVRRQVRVRGRVEQVDDSESDAYWLTRPRGSQLGAWASHQSSVIANRAELDDALAEAEARFPVSVPRPPFWSGYRVIPEELELWEQRTDRLHDRLRYRRENAAWAIERLAP